MSLRLTALSARVRPALVLLLGALTATAGLSAEAGTASLAAVLATTAMLAVAAVALLSVAAPRILTVGARSRAHRESLTSLPEPAHPDTAGRVRSRAPGAVAPAA